MPSLEIIVLVEIDFNEKKKNKKGRKEGRKERRKEGRREWGDGEREREMGKQG